MKKILLIPDSTWGNESGHRSTQFLIKKLRSCNLEVALYCSDDNRDTQSDIFLKNNKIHYFQKKQYRFFHQIFEYFALREFKKVIKAFQPDHVLYFGAISNKTFTEYLIRESIPYYYLPLTTEYYCLKDFAGLEEGTCYKCINGNYFNALKNNCIQSENKYLVFLKKAFERYKSKQRILKANRIIAYSNSQLDVLEKYGVDKEISSLVPIFFDQDNLTNIETSKGDYFVVIGQCSVAKGWHLIPEIIRNTSGIKFKLIIYKDSVANDFIKKYSLQTYIESGIIEIVSNLAEHKDVLNVIAKSKAVIVPSIYPTTGEFALLESMGLSKPVLVFDAGIHKEIFIDRENALVSNIGDVEKFSKDIEDLSTNDELWTVLSKGAFKAFNQITDFKNFDSSMNEILINNIKNAN